MSNKRNALFLSMVAVLLSACSDDKATEETTTTAAESQSATAQSQATTAEAQVPAAESDATKLETKFVTIATGGASGPYNTIGTALAEYYAKTFGANSKTQTTGASVENINLIAQGKVEMAFVMSDALSDAVAGVNNFSSKIDNIRQVAVMYPNYMQVASSERAEINTLDDLKGKRVAVGAHNSGTEVNARSLIEGVGLTYDDVEVDYLGFAEAADALKARKIDAAFLSSGLPNSSLLELEQGFDLKMVSIKPERVDAIAKDKSYFQSAEIPAGTYGNAEAVPTAVIANALVVSADLSDDDVYKLTKAFYESLEVLKTAHQAAGGISLDKGTKGFVAPVHPGAVRYYKEQGIDL